VLDVAEVALILEEEFMIEFPENMLERVHTLHEIAEIIATNWYSVLA